MKKEKIKIEELIDLTLLSEGQLQCLAEEFEKLICEFHNIKPQQNPP